MKIKDFSRTESQGQGQELTSLEQFDNFILHFIGFKTAKHIFLLYDLILVFVRFSVNILYFLSTNNSRLHIPNMTVNNSTLLEIHYLTWKVS